MKDRSARAAFLAAIYAVLVVSSAGAQDEPQPRLMDQPPFDILTLDKTNESKVYKVYPVRLPGRKIPEKPKATDTIRVKLLEDEQEYNIAWLHIAKLELYEQMIVAEIHKLSVEGKLDDAYDELNFLLTYYPNTPGLPEARQHYLYVSSGAAFRQQKYDEALGILEELLAHNPNYRPNEGAASLRERLGDIADRLIGDYVQKEDYRAARALLTRLSKQYKAENEPFAKKWRDKLEQMAAQQRDEARSQIAAGRFVEAHDACSLMQSIWPEVAGGAELAAEIARRHPLVRVGVDHPAMKFDSTSLCDVAARRSGRLMHRLLVERAGLGAEGGKYESPFASILRSDDGLSLTFRLPATREIDGYDLAQRLLTRASEGTREFDATWAQLVASIAVRQPNDVQIDLRTLHVLPEAHLTIPLSSTAKASGTEPYRVLSRSAGATRFIRNENYRFRRDSQPAEIIERVMTDPLRALTAIRRGEIDILDRVFPGDIAGLKSDDALIVVPYAAPTTHVLAVRSKNPYLATASFRRALLYGANRELLLNEGLLRGAVLPGFRLVSSPFAAPVAGMELPTYGYDEQIQPRPFDPRLGMALVLLAEGELKAAFEKQKKSAPKLTPLVLGHPVDEASRVACRGLVKDWKRIGVDCKLVEFAPGVFDDEKQQCDLAYLQLAAWEPVVDARRLLAPGGLAPSDNEHIQLALRQLDAARSWQDVRQRLVVLHRLLHEDATMLPLWQTVDHFVCRRTLQGMASRRLTLYQDIEQWQVRPEVARSGP